MKPSKTSSTDHSRKTAIAHDLIQSVRERISRDEPVHEALPRKGRIHVDRQLPFLIVYRRPARHKDTGTDRLATTEAAYITTSAAPELRRSLADLVRAIAEAQAAHFGAFLIVEIWSARHSAPSAGDGAPRPRFRIVPPADGIGSSPDFLRESLDRIRLGDQTAAVEVVSPRSCAPPGARPLVTPRAADRLSCCLIGVEVDPVYRDPTNTHLYPALLRELMRGLSRALQRSIRKFASTYTTQCPVHYEVLGPRAIVKTVWRSDRLLAELADSFDFLLQVTPVNAEQAWVEFQKSSFERVPEFYYRPMPSDEILLKRKLFSAPVERIEDPTLAELCREKVVELDRQITLLQDIGTKRFVSGSVQLYGGVDKNLMDLARGLVERLPVHDRDDGTRDALDAAAVARLARNELRYYRRRHSEMVARVEIRDDVHSGLMVSRGNLLIGRNTRIPASRVQALLQHEIGTHSLTYHNGRAQPLRQLSVGLAGYEALQEGLAVFSEYLVGGLSPARLRLLALRVIATRHLLDGANFAETFRELHRVHHLERRAAFTVTMRIYRGGGLTKDAVYLAGLARLLRYLRRGGRIDLLLIGKIAAEHVPIVRELKRRGLLKDPPLRPRYLDLPETRQRLEEARRGMSVYDLTRS